VRHTFENHHFVVETVQTYSDGSRRGVNFPTGCPERARGEISPEITCTRSSMKATSCGDGRRQRTVMTRAKWQRRSPLGVWLLNITTGQGRYGRLWPWLWYTTTGKMPFYWPTDHFSGPGRAVWRLCVSVCVFGQ